MRVASEVEADISSQLDGSRIEPFWSRDLIAAIELLARERTWETLPMHGGGRRLTVEGLTVGAFHVFVTVDELDARPDALVVYAIDIWPDGFPT